MSEDLITITACAQSLSVSEGQRVTRQALTKYIKKHDLPTYRVGKRNKVKLSEIAAARESFTREVQRGLHLASDNSAPSPAPVQPSPRSNAPASLDKARDAKTRKENAQAEREELALAKVKGELVDLAQTEAAAVETFAVLKDGLLGPGLSDTADRLISVLGLGDAQKRQVQAAIRESRVAALKAVSDKLTEQIAEMTGDPIERVRDRFDYLCAICAHLKAHPEKSADLLTEATA